MSSKLDYLQKYLSKGENLNSEDGVKLKKKKRKKIKAISGKRGGNLAIVDDDVDWRSLVPEDKDEDSAAEDDPEDRPIVAEMRDESVVKWQPLGGQAASSPTSQGGAPGMRDQSPDLSPPRHSHNSPDSSPPRRRRHDSPDLSPARIQSHHSSDLSPSQYGVRHDSSSPQGRRGDDRRKISRSLQRRKEKHHKSVNQRHSPDISPPRKIRHDSPDISPPRKIRHDSPDISPPRKIRHDSPDISPPRRIRHDSPDICHPRKIRHDSPDISPPRKIRHDSPDISPPRRIRHDSPDISPPRKTRHDSPDISPPRKTRHDSPDLSPPRHKSGTDLSPPRKKSRWNEKEPSGIPAPPRKSVNQSERRPVSPTQMTTGKKSGLQNAEVLRQENAEARTREKEKFQAMDPSDSGRGAETVYRDKEGRKINPKLERLKQKQEEEKKLEEKEKFMEWGRGVATLRMAEDKVKDELYEMSKPLARYADDEDLERMLKERERDGDPMLKFIKKKPKLTPTGKPKKERPTFKGSFPPNRFGIRPGYRWDGVARSNGFEKAWFSRESNKMATQDVAYKWSVENM